MYCNNLRIIDDIDIVQIVEKLKFWHYIVCIITTAE